ncbi:acyl-CoA dehydrogenase C-terminal domain-containing protein [Rhodospirillum rubrum]|uniref:3-methylmercaptopropionyl-CoA dehydrogenase n=1 Tax=Rhodospirillum rubrum (strain ATCC 11170 / ATH 1.1.1 / DSM 467 / LMG 4362 / NCIMB 8255 / S1) TaxID=269796 RepID=Q2RUT6_RHORT|nr:acyl-CoA dehydrogenase C-terminal domain-containing protein [Rhodospirillum rubrum]ABC22109.1 Acyl-CoA dehydrogenase [Rhodospirillum rubrum ATCC 11170]AEO47823.1 butyryl-CoA dehydrogenase [Rhodospirillum rubrum F11]MBK5953698.1 acyl-CoA dehydrogenase [Rhodospirillum rubrum]QXG81759.1 acyl-CoA dehydrogenase C-terminal domain-containing protein [Rhodospirillum rubrum]
MAGYKAPLRDMRYVLYDLFDGASLTTLPGYEEFTADLIDPVLEEAAKICEDVLQPLNRPGDEEGCVLENGVVRTPKGFPEAYRTFREGGWTSITCDPAHGGQGLPQVVNTFIEEMICAANLSFGMYPGLSHGAYVALKQFGTEDQKARYLPALVDGTWTGTMCLTEPQCGTDLGLLRTKAVPDGEGGYKITGTKIFISAGDHDLTENILHLVLARLPDAPKGIKGISLFLVPKVLVTEEGALGDRNAVTCGALEHKMGIKASSTCVLNFDEATGWLIGEPHKGMRAMFAMMNTARLGVGVQGLGLAEASYQGAVAYARDRLQGRSPSGVKAPDKPADPLIVHPDVRRMLLTQRAIVEGGRALAAWVGLALDRQHHAGDPATRAEAGEFVALMTPVVKALLTDLGSEATNLGVQVFGGHGYIREHGMEQYIRDCRITQIYEGTNGIQALDLVGRKLPENAGRNLRRFFHPVADYIEARLDDDTLAEFVGPLAKTFVRLQQATAQVARVGMTKPAEAAAAATDYQRLLGFTALAYLWARMAELSLPKAGTAEDNDAFHSAKVATARVFMERLLPQTSGLFATIMAGGRSLEAFPDAAF